MKSRLDLIEQILMCSDCELSGSCTSGPISFFGETPSKIAILNDAPNKEQDLKGNIFEGEAIDLVNQSLAGLGVNTDGDVTYLNVVSCFPGGPLDSKYIDACSKNKEDQLDLIDPTYVLVLGEAALYAQLPQANIKNLYRRPFLKNGRIHFVVRHPRMAIKNKLFRIAFQEDMEVFGKIVKGDSWIKYLSDHCVSCGQWMIWMDNEGIPTCETHAPIEAKQHMEFSKKQYQEVKNRLNPKEPVQMKMQGA